MIIPITHTYPALRIKPQPDETTCGPTCLYSIYDFYGDSIPLEQIIEEVPVLEGGGTLGSLLANHALRRGYQATIYTYNLQVFDPVWFGKAPAFIKEKLSEQAAFKRDGKLLAASEAYSKFLNLGGELNFEDLTKDLISKYLLNGIPLLTGLSATFLYRSKREYGEELIYDDVRGEPTGHFVVLHGYNHREKTVSVADPFYRNPLGKGHDYEIGIDRVINSILLGIVTYDANVIVIRPR